MLIRVHQQYNFIPYYDYIVLERESFPALHYKVVGRYNGRYNGRYFKTLYHGNLHDCRYFMQALARAYDIF